MVTSFLLPLNNSTWISLLPIVDGVLRSNIPLQFGLNFKVVYAPPRYSCTLAESLLRADTIKACGLIYLFPWKNAKKNDLTMNGPKNLDLYLEAEKMIFMCSVQYTFMWRLAVMGKVYWHTTADYIRSPPYQIAMAIISTKEALTIVFIFHYYVYWNMTVYNECSWFEKKSKCIKNFFEVL